MDFWITVDSFLWFYTKLPATGDADQRGVQGKPGAAGDAALDLVWFLWVTDRCRL